MNALVKFWNEADLLRSPFLHPADDEAVGVQRLFSDRETLHHGSFVKSRRFGQEGDKSFHLSLLPVPYQGNLATAEVFIVLLNPGLGLGDYCVQDDREHSRQLRKILRQDFRGIEYPFLSLNPQFAWAGGFVWWEKKLRRILRVIARRRFDGRYLDALKFMSSKIASIELVPYHSNGFGAQSWMKRMPSFQVAQKYIEGVLAKRAVDGKVTIVVARQSRLLDLPRRRNIVLYDRGLSRGAHLGPETKGGKAILAQLGCG